MTTASLTATEVLAIHDDLIVRYGGSKGVRDPGQLEAARARPFLRGVCCWTTFCCRTTGN